MDIDNTLEYIKATERRKLGVRRKQAGSIIPTAEIVTRMPVNSHGKFKQFKSDVLTKMLVALILIPAWVIALVILVSYSFNYRLAWAFVGFSVLLGGLIWKRFYSKRLNYTITVSAEGLSLNNELYRWEEIKETAILDLPVGKYGARFLVIVFLNDSYHVKELANFLGLGYPFHQKLARYIEHFKAAAKD